MLSEQARQRAREIAESLGPLTDEERERLRALLRRERAPEVPAPLARSA